MNFQSLLLLIVFFHIFLFKDLYTHFLSSFFPLSSKLFSFISFNLFNSINYLKYSQFINQFKFNFSSFISIAFPSCTSTSKSMGKMPFKSTKSLSGSLNPSIKTTPHLSNKNLISSPKSPSPKSLSSPKSAKKMILTPNFLIPNPLKTPQNSKINPKEKPLHSLNPTKSFSPHHL